MALLTVCHAIRSHGVRPESHHVVHAILRSAGLRLDMDRCLLAPTTAAGADLLARNGRGLWLNLLRVARVVWQVCWWVFCRPCCIFHLTSSVHAQRAVVHDGVRLLEHMTRQVWSQVDTQDEQEVLQVYQIIQQVLHDDGVCVCLCL